MKKTLLSILFILIVTSSSFAATLYTTTIKNAAVDQVVDTLVQVLTAKNFTVDEITPYKVTFNKAFGDGFWVASQFQTVIFNLIPRDGDIKMMVSQTELVQGVMKRQRSIDHMIPIIKEVKNSIDGTPLDSIQNETVDPSADSEKEKGKKLGLKIKDKGKDGLYRIESVDPESAAAGAKLAANDAIIEINGRVMSEYGKAEVEAYIANKWDAGSSLIMVIKRDIKKIMITLKRED